MLYDHRRLPCLHSRPYQRIVGEVPRILGNHIDTGKVLKTSQTRYFITLFFNLMCGTQEKHFSAVVSTLILLVTIVGIIDIHKITLIKELNGKYVCFVHLGLKLSLMQFYHKRPYG